MGPGAVLAVPAFKAQTSTTCRCVWSPCHGAIQKAGHPASAEREVSCTHDVVQHMCWCCVLVPATLRVYVCRLLYSLLHKRHVPPFAEVAAALAGAYTVYLCTGEGQLQGGCC